MSVEIYYFSGTGNSLSVAREIAAKVNGKLTSISSVVDKESVRTDADVIGIVFPVYYVGLSNLPLIVRRFAMKLENINGKYIFAVCTYGGGSGLTLKLLDQIIRSRGGRLAAGFGVQMPQNAFDKPFENREKLAYAWKKNKLAIICDHINDKRPGRLDTDGFVSHLVISLLVSLMGIPLLRPFFIRSIYRSAGVETNLSLPFAEVMPLIDHSFNVDERCTGCGTCAKVCPVHNIKMAGGKPSWQHHCENCLACINWCPQKAIHGYAELPNLRRYHHPEVKLADMMGQAKTLTGED